MTVEVRVEVATGLNRSGEPPAEAARLAALVRELPGLELDGILTFRGSTFPGSAGRSPAELGREEGEMMGALANELHSAGISVRSVSVGSTPTAACAAVDAGSKVFCGDLYPANLGLAGYGFAFGGLDAFVERMSLSLSGKVR